MVVFSPHEHPRYTRFVLGHEVMHGLGLYYTHKDLDPIIEPEIKYVYPIGNTLSNTNKPMATNNTMSYSYLRPPVLWQWQKRFINLK